MTPHGSSENIPLRANDTCNSELINTIALMLGAKPIEVLTSLMLMIAPKMDHYKALLNIFLLFYLLFVQPFGNVTVVVEHSPRTLSLRHDLGVDCRVEYDLNWPLHELLATINHAMYHEARKCEATC